LLCDLLAAMEIGFGIVLLLGAVFDRFDFILATGWNSRRKVCASVRTGRIVEMILASLDHRCQHDVQTPSAVANSHLSLVGLVNKINLDECAVSWLDNVALQ
jgi:hypothetical protein